MSKRYSIRSVRAPRGLASTAVTSEAWITLAVAGLFAAGDWYSRLRHSKPLEYVCKPAALVGLLGVAVLLDPADGTQRAWFVAALACSLAGDVFLMLPSDRFVAGLAAFLVGHLCYLGGFWAGGPPAAAMAVALVVVAALVAPVATRLMRALGDEDRRPFRGPVAAYIAVISLMLASALASGDELAAAGAALFVFSDTLIAWDRFVTPLRWAPVAIMVTYHLGQAGLTLSLPG